MGGGAVGRRERRENAFSLWTVVYERRDERQALISNRSRGKHFVADLELEVEMAVGTMDECGEKEARSGLTVANKRHDPDKKIQRQDWTGKRWS